MNLIDEAVASVTSIKTPFMQELGRRIREAKAEAAYQMLGVEVEYVATDDRDLEPGEPQPPEDDFEPEQTDLPQPKTDEPEE